MHRIIQAVFLGSFTVLTACGNLLPSEKKESVSAFANYDDAVERYAQAQPGITNKEQLFDLGFDPIDDGNGRLLSFIDLRMMFVQPNVPIEYLPDGLIHCLEAKDRCVGYAFEFTKSDTQRVGSFWADALNFQKKRETLGWSFRTVFVVVDDMLVHKVSNGEPKIRQLEAKRNPLGPLQGAGEYLSDQLW